MITITFDATALFIGFVIGMLLGGIICSVVETREGGPWSSGYTTGYKSGVEVRKYIEQSVRNELSKERKHDHLA